MHAQAIGGFVAGLVLTACVILPGPAWGQAAQPAVGSAETKPIGKVITLKGTAKIEHVDAVVLQASVANSGQAKIGDFVYRGDIVETGADSALGITFNDGTTFNVSSKARMVLNEFVYDPKGKSNSTLISLTKGTFTFIAGQVAKTGDMKVETPVATMGIRGTTPHVEISEDGTVSFSTLVEDDRTKTPGQQNQRAPAVKRQARVAPSPTTSSPYANAQSCNDRTSSDAQIAGCTALIDMHGDTPQLLLIAHNNRGNAYIGKGRYDLAIKDYDQSIKIEPRASTFNNRGVAYQKKGEFDRAIEDFEEAIKLAPDYVSAFANRAETYRKKGENDRAIQDYDEAIRLQPTLPAVWNGRCWTRAIIGQLQEALSDCNEALRLQPNVAATLDSRGFTYLKMSQWDLAINDYNLALRQNRRLASSLYGRGFARLKKGDTAGGNRDIAAAKAIEANIAQVFVRYGVQ